MRASSLFFMALLVSIPLCASAGETPAAAGVDSRYPVQVSPEGAVRQKTEMRGNLAALRDTLAKLAEKDFPGVENSLRKLAHSGPVAERPGASTKVFRDLEAEFEASVDKAVMAARSGNIETVLRSLSDTMGYCQSCHSAFREDLGSVPGAPAAK
jgi:hypothetical protein